MVFSFGGRSKSNNRGRGNPGFCAHFADCRAVAGEPPGRDPALVSFQLASVSRRLSDGKAIAMKPLRPVHAGLLLLSFLAAGCAGKPGYRDKSYKREDIAGKTFSFL